MKYIWLHHPVDQLHWQVLKNSLLSLLLLPLVNLGHNFIQQFHRAEQIVVYFYALNFAIVAFILVFYGALKTLNLHLKLASNRVESYLLSAYRHLPMLCLTGIIIYFSLYLF